MRTEDLKRWAQTGQTPGCPISSTLADIFSRQDREAICRNAQHISQCPSCQQEMARLSPAPKTGKSTFRTITECFLLGVGFWAIVGLIRGANGIINLVFEKQKPYAADQTPEVVRTLKQIEHRLDVAGNPTNNTGQRQGPITR